MGCDAGGAVNPAATVRSDAVVGADGLEPPTLSV